MGIVTKLNETLSKMDAKEQAKQLAQWLKKQKLEKGSDKEKSAIEKWFDSKDFDDSDADRIMKHLK